MNKQSIIFLTLAIICLAAVKIEAIDIPEIDLCYVPCPREVKPLCGSDGTTYQNACYFGVAKCQKNSLKIIGQGTCKALNYFVKENPEEALLNAISTIKTKKPSSSAPENLQMDGQATQATEFVSKAVEEIFNARSLGIADIPTVAGAPQAIKNAASSLSLSNSSLSSNMALAKGVGKVAQGAVSKNISGSVGQSNLLKGKNPIQNFDSSELSKTLKNSMQLKNSIEGNKNGDQEDVISGIELEKTLNSEFNNGEEKFTLEYVEEIDVDGEEYIKIPKRILQKLPLKEPLKLSEAFSNEALKAGKFQLPVIQKEGSKLFNAGNGIPSGFPQNANANFLAEKQLNFKPVEVNKKIGANKNLDLKAINLPFLSTIPPQTTKYEEFISEEVLNYTSENSNDFEITEDLEYSDTQSSSGEAEIEGFSAIGLEKIGKKKIGSTDGLPTLFKGDLKKPETAGISNLGSQLSDSIGKINLDKQKSSNLMRGVRS